MAFGGKGIARLETEKGPFVVFVQNAFPAKPSKPSREVQVKARRMSLVEGARKADFELNCRTSHPRGALRHGAHRAPARMEDGHRAGPVPQNRRGGKFGRRVPRPCALSGDLALPEQNGIQLLRNPARPRDRRKGGRLWAGLQAPGTWWAVENLDADSGLFDPLVESTLHEVRRVEATGCRPGIHLSAKASSGSWWSARAWPTAASSSTS